MIVHWQAAFARDWGEIDADHRMVVDVINELDVAIAVGSPREVIGRALEVLATRIAEHFRREEADLAEDGEPRRRATRAEHQEILARIHSLRDDWHRGDRATLDRGRLLALARWWVNHMDTSHRR